jgi:hypothetical protein
MNLGRSITYLHQAAATEESPIDWQLQEQSQPGAVADLKVEPGRVLPSQVVEAMEESVAGQLALRWVLRSRKPVTPANHLVLPGR